MAAPDTGGSENGAGRNTSPGTSARGRSLRGGAALSLPAAPSALPIGGGCPSITPRGGPSGALAATAEAASRWLGREAGEAAGWRLESHREGQATPKGLLCPPRTSVPASRCSCETRGPRALAFRTCHITHPSTPSTSNSGKENLCR